MKTKTVSFFVAVVMAFSVFAPAFGDYVGSVSVLPDASWSTEETFDFVDTVVFPVFRDPLYYPGSDVKMGTFAILSTCTGGCDLWVAHVVDVDSISPDYMCAWVYRCGMEQDFGRHRRTNDGGVVEVMTRGEYITGLRSFLADGIAPDCPQFLEDR